MAASKATSKAAGSCEGMAVAGGAGQPGEEDLCDDRDAERAPDLLHGAGRM
jgi:hypothetical protein